MVKHCLIIWLGSLDWLTKWKCNIVFVIEVIKKISKIDPTEVVSTFRGFEQRLLRHAEDGDVNERAFTSLRIQSNSCS